MRSFISALLLVSSVAHTMPVYADDTDQIKGTISPLREGQKSPFSGVVLDARATADVVTRLSSIPDRINVEVEKCRKEDTARCDARTADTKDRCTAEKKILQASIDDKMNTIKALEEKLKTFEDPPSRTTWAGIGFVGGVLMSVATVFAINQATK